VRLLLGWPFPAPKKRRQGEREAFPCLCIGFRWRTPQTRGFFWADLFLFQRKEDREKEKPFPVFALVFVGERRRRAVSFGLTFSCSKEKKTGRKRSLSLSLRWFLSENAADARFLLG
jgi:hypothetical protein